MKFNFNQPKSYYETLVIFILIIFSCFLTFYSHLLGLEIPLTSFFYIPIVMAAIWWKRKGLLVTVFMVVLLLYIGFNSSTQIDYIYILFRSVIFVIVGIITVILSERIEKSQVKLKTSEEGFRSVVESALDGIITTNQEGNVVFVNESFQKMFQYSDEEVIGKAVKMFIPPRLRDKYDQKLKEFHKTGQRQVGTFESVGLKKDGEEFPFEMSITSWEGEGELFTTSIIRDITYRKNAEKAQSLLSAIVEGSTESIIAVNLEGKILSWNKGAKQCYGYSAKEAIGKSYSMLFPENSSEYPQILDTIAKGEKIGHYETKRVTKSGKLIDISLIISPLKDKEGDIVGFSAISRDITQDKAAKEALARSESQLSMITTNMADIICQTNLDGVYIYVSPSVESVLGYQPQDLVGKSMLDRVHPDDRSRVASCMQDAGGKCMTRSVQYRYQRADGQYVWLGTTGTPTYDDNGQVTGFLCNSRDITNQRNAEDALRESEAKYRTLVESASDPIFLYDDNGIFLMANKAGAHGMGKEPADLLGHSLKEFFPPEVAEKQLDLIRKVVNTGEGVDLEMHVPYEDRDKWFSTSLQPIYGRDNQIHSVQVISRDITEIKETQLKLEQALKDKEMLMKEIYHRVKNNLMVISSLLNLQSRYIKDEEAKAMFKQSQERAQSMAMIHERLYRSADLKHINFGDYIRKLAQDLFRTYVSDPSRIKLEMDVDDVMIDINIAIPLGLMVNELISNSMKHAFPGDYSGKIRVKFKEHDSQCMLEVSDTGVGFPPEFEFEKSDSLGLQLINSLTQQISGELELESNHGTTFKITFQQPEDD